MNNFYFNKFYSNNFESNNFESNKFKNMFVIIQTVLINKYTFE